MDAWLAKRRKSRRLVRGKGGKMRPGTALISPTTIHNEESALQAMFRWAIRLKKIPDPDDPRRPLRALPWELAPEDRPRPETHRRRRIPDDHVRAIAEGLDPVSSEADLFILLALLTGARGEDLEALRWEHWTGTAWDLAGTSKTRQGVLWPVPKAFRPAVGRLASEGHVFDPPPSYRRIRNRTRALCGEAYSVKAFRHTLSSGFMAAGVHPRLTKAIMSHAFPRDVTQGYQWPTEQELLKAISAPWWVPILCRRAKNWGRIGGKRRKIQAA
jgi:integrase